MAPFYGIEDVDPCNRPLDISEIMSLSGNVQDWALTQLTLWVRANGGDLRRLLDDAMTHWSRDLIRKTWEST